MILNIYKIEQSINRDYDVYDSAVVLAATPEDAQKMLPSEHTNIRLEWAEPEHVKVTLLGVALRAYDKPQVICASYNFG